MAQTNRTLLLLQDEAISKALHQHNTIINIIGAYSDSVQALHSLSLANHFIISDRLIEEPTEYLAEALKINPNLTIVFLMSNNHNSIANERVVRFCKGHGVKIIYPGQTVDSVVSILLEMYNVKVEQENKTPVVAFIGTTPNIGTTTIALNSAIMLANKMIGDVAYLELNLRSAKVHRYAYFDDDTKGFDAIVNDLKSKTLTERTLERNMQQINGIPNLYILTGTKHREKASFYGLEEIKHLIDIAKSRFSLVLVDVHAYWDNAATLQGILQSNHRYIVTSTEITNIEDDYKTWYERIAFGLTYHLDPKDFDVVINQSYGTFGRRNVAKATKLSIMTEVPLYAEDLRQAANIGKPIVLTNPKHPFIKDMEPIVKAIIAEYKFPVKEENKKKGIRDFLSFPIKKGAV